MFELSFIELFVIAIVAILTLGPKDIPIVVRKISELFREFSSVSRDIKHTLQGALDETGLEEARKELESEWKEGQKYIVDQEGKVQEIYDISEFLEAEGATPPRVFDKKPTEEEVEPPSEADAINHLLNKPRI